MRSVIWLVLLFAVAVVAALTLGDNDGLVTFYWGGWRLDLSLNFFVLAALATGFAVVSVVKGIDALVGLPRRARAWRALRVERAAQAAFRDALAEYFAGRYTRAAKAAQRAIDLREDADALGDDPALRQLSQLLIAGSMNRLQDRARRDAAMQALLAAPRRIGTALDEGTRMLAAEWALDDRDASLTLTLLAELGPGPARRTQALRLKLQATRQLRRPMEALHTARLLANHQAFSPLAAQSLLRSLAFEVLDTARDAEQLRRAWAQLDDADRSDPFVVARAARRGAAVGALEDARQWLRPLWDRLDALDADGRAQVAPALAEVVSGIGAEWLPRLEAAQRKWPADVAVQGAVGAALAERRLWGKARRPLEQAARDEALDPRARRRAWRALAALAREEGDEPRAGECDRAAAAID
jgi:HemY protein